MKDQERDDLFQSARGVGRPTADDRARVRAAVGLRLGLVAGATVGATMGATAAKAAASVGSAATASGSAGAGLSALAVAKAAVVVAMTVALGVAVGVAVVPPKHASTKMRGADDPSSSTSAVAKASTVGSPLTVEEPREHLSPVRPALPSAEESSSSPPSSSASPLPSLAVHGGLNATIKPPPALEPFVEAPTPVRSALIPESSAKAAPSAEELALMTQVQQGLRSGDNARVLELVAEHERRFPASAWAPEREGARVLASCAGAQPGEARKLGAAFVARYPQSPLGAHVRATCGLPQ